MRDEPNTTERRNLQSGQAWIVALLIGAAVLGCAAAGLIAHLLGAI
jgi:hypothetical protein